MKFLGFEIRKVKNDTSKIVHDEFHVNSQSIFTLSPYMTRSQLLANSTVNACIRVISNAVAVLPMNIYQKTDSGRKQELNFSLAKLLKSSPNKNDTAFTFKQTLMFNLLICGNAFIFVERNSDFTPKALYNLDPELITIKLDEQGEVYYVYHVNGKDYKYNSSSILHIPALRTNSVRGVSPLGYSTHAAKLGLVLDEFTNENFDGGIHSKLVIKVPQEERNWKAEDSQKLSDRIMAAYGGKENANKPFILSHGLDYGALELAKNRDSQLVENRQYSADEVAKLFGVPRFMLGSENSKFTNMEQANTLFLQNTLTPWLVCIQEYFNRLLCYPCESENFYIEFNTDAMLRADYSTRWTNHRENFRTGLFTLNQIMDKENMPRITEKYGDEHFGLENYKPLSQSLQENNSDEDSGDEKPDDEKPIPQEDEE